MPKRVEFDGQTHEFPDDFTDADIAAALGSAPQQRAQSAPAGGMLPTGGAFLGSLAGSFTGPLAPVTRVLGAGIGGALGKGVEMLTDEQDQSFGEGARAMGLEALKQGGMEAAGGVVGKGIKLLGSGLYRGGVALLPKTLKQQYPDIVATGLKEGIALTRRGATKAGALVSASRNQADALLANAEKAGASAVSPRKVVTALRPVKAKMKTQAALGLPDETPALAQRAKTFAARNRGGIPLTKAQTLKREAQDLAETAYKARDKGATINSLEALTNEAQARGLREGIESIVPAVGPVNARTQSLMGLTRGAEHASETGHILSRLGGIGGGALLGSAGGMLPAVAGAGAGLALSTPGGLTATGLMLRKTGSAVGLSPQLLRAALLAQMLGDTPEP